MSCNCSTHQHDQQFEAMFNEVFTLSHQPDTPLTELLETLQLGWDDLPTLQAQQLVAIFHEATTTAAYVALEQTLHDDKASRQRVIELYRETVGMFDRRANNLADLRAVIEAENADLN